LELSKTYYSSRTDHSSKYSAVESCLEYLYARKDEIKILFSKNAENRVSGFGLDIVNDSVKRIKANLPNNSEEDVDDVFLRAIITSSASYGLIQIWLTTDIDKSPKEILNLLVETFGDNFLA